MHICLKYFAKKNHLKENEIFFELKKTSRYGDYTIKTMMKFKWKINEKEQTKTSVHLHVRKPF